MTRGTLPVLKLDLRKATFSSTEQNNMQEQKTRTVLAGLPATTNLIGPYSSRSPVNHNGQYTDVLQPAERQASWKPASVIPWILSK